MSNLASLIQPMPGLIAVQVDTKDEITPQGLLVSREIAKTIHESQRPTHGRVVATGDDGTEPGDNLINVGDHVLFSKFTGTKISRTVPGPDPEMPKKGETYEVIIIMREDDILAKIMDSSAAETLKVRA